MTMLDLDPDDNDAVEELHADIRDHLAAAAVSDDPEMVAGFITQERHLADALCRLALTLRRNPEMARKIADHLDAIAANMLTAPWHADPVDDEEAPSA